MVDKVHPTPTRQVIEQQFRPRGHDRPNKVEGCVDLCRPFRFPKAAQAANHSTAVARDQITPRCPSIEHAPQKTHMRGLGYTQGWSRRGKRHWKMDVDRVCCDPLFECFRACIRSYTYVMPCIPRRKACRGVFHQTQPGACPKSNSGDRRQENLACKLHLLVKPCGPRALFGVPSTQRVVVIVRVFQPRMCRARQSSMFVGVLARRCCHRAQRRILNSMGLAEPVHAFRLEKWRV